uniref:Clathrin/coatomer adaptor adaptin-like N-terminal domain-containing protein n=1 Tax=Ditylum brightwellii TaxID=49249 RepID=A0A7S1ZTK9_9STRA|mmetsp:Transcript_38640/g.57979  ORF Transcript_38640/g.57979 Transcript_38640/m.57979 type:complete len:1369 (+) Transcript_38640:66-4172(+)
MFEKTLTDVVKGIRASKRNTALYISQCIAEIKTEINSTDLFTKANALQKLTFLQMMGYNMSWASFATIETMSSPRFGHKRIGYLAASQGFNQNTDVILLTTNTLKKELRGAVGGGMSGVYEAGLAINCLSNIVTEDLARELLPDLTNLTSHPQPYLRKKALLCLFKLFVKYPQGLRLTFSRVQQCLDDTHPSVVSCAVNVITELSDKNPRNYLHLAPAFFQLLTTSSNNWMLIKVVKLLGSLVPEEPRLARKLLDPLATIVRNTQAKSLLYEAVYTITLSLPYARKADGSMPASMPSIVALCAETLKTFVEEQDQNLKYLGLVGFGSLMVSHPKVLSSPDYRPLVLACLSDEDVTIRTRALDLLTGMTTRKNLRELVTQLLRHVDLATGEYKSDLVAKIIEMCSGEKYALLVDFEWYLDVLITLAYSQGIEQHGDLISGQIVDVALRVLPVRAYAVRRMADVLLDGTGRKKQKGLLEKEEDIMMDGTTRGECVMPEILPGAAWIVGEYSHLIETDSEIQYDVMSRGTYHSIIQAVMAPSNVDNILTSTQSVYVQCGMKVLAAASNAGKKCSDVELEACAETLTKSLPVFMQSVDVEVQERAFTSYHLLTSLGIIKASSLDGDNAFAPGLTPLDKEEEDESSEEESEEENAEGDLLDLVGSRPPASSNIKKTKKPSSSPATINSDLNLIAGGTLASRCRDVSKTLQYLLTPDPMKPVSAKAQRKKRLSPPTSLKLDLDAPINMSIFSSLLADERAQFGIGGGKLSIEAVSFTQQRPMRPADPTPVDTSFILSDSASTPNSGLVNNSNASQSFQHSGMTPQQRPQNQNQHDPFYLNSASPAMVEGTAFGSDPVQQSQTGQQPSSRFGTIQLVDGDDSDDDTHGRHKKKKKKHKKDKKQRKKDDIGLSFGDADFAALSGATEKAKSIPHATAALADLTVYSSEDDGDNDDNLLSMKPSAASKRGARSNEFKGLAKVDLTTPLRDDEVMPRNEHRVVPEKTVEEEESLGEEHGKKKKKKRKKEKKEKKKNGKKEEIETASIPSTATGDLLDFGGILSDGGAPTSSAAPTATPAPAAHPINSAFDDLLGLTAELAPTLPLAQPEEGIQGFTPIESPATKPLSSKKVGKSRVWQRGTIKASHAKQVSVSGGGRSFDWGNVSLEYRTQHAKAKGGGVGSALVILRVVNNTPDTALQNISVLLNGMDDPISLGDRVNAGSAVESNGKIGPFSYSASSPSLEIKGSLRLSGWSVPIKLTLPATMRLNPVAGLSLDAVMGELSANRWESHSAKVEVTSGLETAKAKSVLGSFLRAEEVDGGSSAHGTFASQTNAGTQVRVLIKVKESAGVANTVKVDIKCTDGQLCKSLISDVKKIIL